MDNGIMSCWGAFFAPKHLYHSTYETLRSLKTASSGWHESGFGFSIIHVNLTNENEWGKLCCLIPDSSAIGAMVVSCLQYFSASAQFILTALMRAASILIQTNRIFILARFCWRQLHGPFFSLGTYCSFWCGPFYCQFSYCLPLLGFLSSENHSCWSGWIKSQQRLAQNFWQQIRGW